MTASKPVRVAILDDYQNVALTLADWSPLQGRAEITLFNDHLADADEVVERLAPFEVLCVMRERTPLPRAIIERLPNLKLIVSTGARNASIDLKATLERGIPVATTGYDSTPTVEFSWALLMAAARHIPSENAAFRAGRWQESIGIDLAGKNLGLLGLGKIGSRMAALGHAFGMKTIAWSENLTAERCTEHGTEHVSKEQLFARADFLAIHLVLSKRSRGLVGAAELGLMKPAAWLINTSRGPIVQEAALIAALQEKRIAGAAIDVYDTEPLPEEHPLRTLPNLLATPHIGYVTERMYRVFYGDTVKNIVAWLDGKDFPKAALPS